MKHFLLAALLTLPGAARAQQVLQFTGLVVSGDSLVGVPEVRVRVLPTQRHTVTAPSGYFSLPVRAGDSVEVQGPTSTVRLRVPPDYARASYSLLVQLPAEAGPARVQPLPASFARRFLALQLPPPLTVDTPPVSRRALVLPLYDNKGRRTNAPPPASRLGGE